MQPIIVYLIGFIFFCLVVLFFNHYRDRTFDYLSRCHKKISSNFWYWFIFILIFVVCGYCVGGLIVGIIFGVIGVILHLYFDHICFVNECKIIKKESERLGVNIHPGKPICFKQVGDVKWSRTYTDRFCISYEVYPYAFKYKNKDDKMIESIFEPSRLKRFLEQKYRDKVSVDVWHEYEWGKGIINIYDNSGVTIEELEKEVNEEYFRVRNMRDEFKQKYVK